MKILKQNERVELIFDKITIFSVLKIKTTLLNVRTQVIADVTLFIYTFV